MANELNILAVDDESAVAESLSYVLEGPNRHFATAGDGEEALRQVAAKSFDIIITDHRMPRLGGLDLVRRLRAQKFPGKIIVLSAHLSAEDVLAYETLKVDQILAKPFDTPRLRELIKRFEKR